MLKLGTKGISLGLLDALVGIIVVGQMRLGAHTSPKRKN